MKEHQKVKNVIILAGEILLHNGAEIFRVQDTMIKIGEAYGVVALDVYVISNGMFISLSEDGEQYSTGIKHIPLAPAHLGRIAAVNELSRKVVEGKYSATEAYKRLEEIKQIPYKPKYFQVLCSGVGSGCFCYLLGGTVADMLPAFLSGIILYLFVFFATEKQFSKIMINILGSALVTLCGILFLNLGMGEQLDNIIIGSIIPLVPGVPLTNSVRDFFNSDYLSGIIRLIDALLIAFCIAIGVGVMLKLWDTLLIGGIIQWHK